MKCATSGGPSRGVVKGRRSAKGSVRGPAKKGDDNDDGDDSDDDDDDGGGGGGGGGDDDTVSAIFLAGSLI